MGSVWEDGAMMLEDLVSLRPAIAELCARYGVVELSVFGSTVRGDAGVDSDVDLLYVRGANAPRGLAFFSLQRELESLLGRPVDLVPTEGLHWVIRDRVLDGAEILYAA
jgi:uncharacterized protein